MSDILVHMDMLLENALANGDEPQHWMIREADWLALRDRFRANAVPDPALFGANTYRGVPVHFSKLDTGQIVGIADRHGVASIT